MIPLHLRDVVALTGGALHPASPSDDPSGARPEDLLVDGPVTTDSRECGPGSLFVARVGEHADGHAFAAAARSAGAVAVLGERPVPELGTVVVPDVQSAFGALARGVHDRARAGGLRTVAITGSSGKTSTKDLLGQVLATAGPTVAPVGSYNGEIGVPLTVCRVEPATRFLVAEMGARGVGHIAYLTRIAPPDVAVVLNVGLAHVGEFGSQDAIARAKGELVEALSPDGTAVLNADDPRVAAMASRTPGHVVTVGVEQPADVTAGDVVLDAAGRASFTLHGWGLDLPVRLAVSGAHQVGNALSVVAAAVAVGLDPTDAVAALGAAGAASRWRMEVHEREDGVTVVNDAYNANPDSMAAALRALRAIADAPTAQGGARRRTVAVLGAMLELGDQADAEHAGIGRLATELGVDRVLVVGEGARAVAAGSDPAVTTLVADTDAAYDVLQRELRAGDVVLLKSSRDAGLRWLGDRLAGVPLPAGAGTVPA
ncbi:UDP-N-acetylmuramoyl-tripeptide--D-alanyl-D-alanine ligase [Lapillicoccus jejuensis]|uniref:UDP-N-acetylmuramoyl-tripeptide--D-alanyl-D-alanine ligase n=1 Tax=Lapillicoccus jejuensis TaxID=402171 RepID=A0A542E6R8_9MICO|nr:UDP-N-acetylmuramoyl-tripeptide--D-alanyl-D-alanine ligase [Lapillicoccus jejuensis]TQJ11031.1 UDP-N-acetylmuramoyl-tripeptide--D-alanyl-D-alanine ligase [Lapillicoccus jejuensis]